MADPSGDMILEALHFLVEIGNPRHARLSGTHSIRSYDCHVAEALAGSNRMAAAMGTAPGT